VYVSAGSVTLDNVTIVNNSAVKLGAACATARRLTITNSTISGNNGGSTAAGHHQLRRANVSNTTLDGNVVNTATGWGGNISPMDADADQQRAPERERRNGGGLFATAAARRWMG